MLHICTMLWDANDKSFAFSRCYDESWVEKLYRQFARHLSCKFRFICFTERDREFKEPILQMRTLDCKPGYGAYVEPYQLNEPMILVGLDTLIIKNIDHFGEYCLDGVNQLPALPRNPYQPDCSINGVALVPKGNRGIYEDWRGEDSMVFMRRFPVRYIDDLWPGQVLSLKFHKLRAHVPSLARIVYMHGIPKQHQLLELPLVKEHWR